MKSTHTVATLNVSKVAFDEIADLLRDAGYSHVFLDGNVIDMTGIGLTHELEEETPREYDCELCSHHIVAHHDKFPLCLRCWLETR